MDIEETEGEEEKDEEEMSCGNLRSRVPGPRYPRARGAAGRAGDVIDLQVLTVTDQAALRATRTATEEVQAGHYSCAGGIDTVRSDDLRRSLLSTHYNIRRKSRVTSAFLPNVIEILAFHMLLRLTSVAVRFLANIIIEANVVHAPHSELPLMRGKNRTANWNESYHAREFQCSNWRARQHGSNFTRLECAPICSPEEVSLRKIKKVKAGSRSFSSFPTHDGTSVFTDGPVAPKAGGVASLRNVDDPIAPKRFSPYFTAKWAVAGINLRVKYRRPLKKLSGETRAGRQPRSVI
ncbi:hypothetical protein EVAR_7113_1 [Eumeta japonica]|uniref:Uncharacterized protein n=1 Tax=Eumeta variegata TaxID=151549 RepID=A0A4C1U6J2_EUMVA|nr:hypothetical protein EVAR_7113_1 [Eumeta japonica]